MAVRLAVAEGPTSAQRQSAALVAEAAGGKTKLSPPIHGGTAYAKGCMAGGEFGLKYVNSGYQATSCFNLAFPQYEALLRVTV